MAMVADGLTCKTRDENRMDNGHFLVGGPTTIIDCAGGEMGERLGAHLRLIIKSQ